MRLPRTTIVASVSGAPPLPSMTVAPTIATSVSGTATRRARCLRSKRRCAELEENQSGDAYPCVVTSNGRCGHLLCLG